MMKMFSKKMKNQKGFTLVELIVVIAVLGILAAIAVPRFGGFTDRAKIASDEQLVAIAKNSALTLIASGDIKSTQEFTITYTKTATESGINYTINPEGSYVARTTGDTFDTAMKELVGNNTLQIHSNFTLTFDANGDYKTTSMPR